MLRIVAYASDNKQTEVERVFAALAATHPGGSDRIGFVRRALEMSGKAGVGAGAVA
jgi:hypothetical protein